MGRTIGNSIVRCGYAAIAVTLAVVVRLLLDPLLNERYPFVALFGAVAFMAWYGGRGLATFTLVLGLAAVSFFILEPRYTWSIEHHEDVFGLLFYSLICAGSIALFEQLRVAFGLAEEKTASLRQQYEALQQEADRRRRAEAAVIEEREQLRVTLACIGDGVITTDAAGQVTFLNHVAEQLTGWTQQEAKGVPLERVFQIVNETTRQPVENPALRSLKEGQIVGLANHTVLLAKDGAERPIDDSAAPIRDAQGHVFGSVLVFRDISERKSTEVILAAQKRVLELLVHGAPLSEVLDAICEVIERQSQQKLIATVLLLDEDGQRLRSAAGRRAPPDYTSAIDGLAIGPSVGSCGTAAHRGQQVIVTDIATDPLWKDFRNLALNHGLRACWSTPILSSVGQVLGTFAVYYATPRGPTSEESQLVDILTRTAAVAIERRRAEEALRNADRSKDEFLATLAHELRNPLAPIRNGLQILRLAGSENGVAAEARSMMDRQLNQLIRLVDDLLDVSRITRNKLDLRKHRVELASVVHSAVETSRPLIEQLGHTLSVTLPPTPIYLDADLTRLAQVFSNLLNNSAKYTAPGGHIALTAEIDGAEVAVKVRDNGLGIPAEALPQIFDMFSQVDRNLERSQGGLGIGLTLVRRLVEMHGGTVEARSDGPGQGSEFITRLPVVTVPEVVQPSADRGDTESAAALKRRILIVDDNQDAALSLGLTLRLMGSETCTAHDGLAALEAAESFRPDVILLDLGLPKLNGYDVCRRIREQGWSSGMIIIALTGWGQEDDRRRSTGAGFDHHLVKPVDADEIYRLLLEDQDLKSMA